MVKYDLNTGDIVWRIPTGVQQAPPEYNIPNNTGVQFPRNAALVTGGGLIFLATGPERKVHAYDRGCAANTRRPPRAGRPTRRSRRSSGSRRRRTGIAERVHRIRVAAIVPCASGTTARRTRVVVSVVAATARGSSRQFFSASFEQIQDASAGAELPERSALQFRPMCFESRGAVTPDCDILGLGIALRA
jgi:hypothetical protein